VTRIQHHRTTTPPPITNHQSPAVQVNRPDGIFET
jgi:hypothetical protein